MSADFIRYPRTYHMQGSGGLERGHDRARLEDFAGHQLVIEEKLDGSQVWMRAQAGELVLGSRGDALRGSARGEFALLKSWLAPRHADIVDILGERYLLFGEWLQRKHTVFYDALPHYLMIYDVVDLETGEFLSTPRRYALLELLEFEHVPVLWSGPAEQAPPLASLVGPSLYKSLRWRDTLAQAAREAGRDPDEVLERESDSSDEAEGLYLKVETDAHTVGWYKYVRPGFLRAIADAESHWRERGAIDNRLASGQLPW